MVKIAQPMGWNSRNTFGDRINDKLIRESADAMVLSGLSDAGYEYIVIDNCRSLRERDSEGYCTSQPCISRSERYLCFCKCKVVDER